MKEINDIKDQMIRWNESYPIDLWWRRKYKIPYGSNQHLDMCMVDMRFEYEEDVLISQIISEKSKQHEEEPQDLISPYVAGKANYLLSQKRFIEGSVQVDSLEDIIRNPDGTITIRKK